MVGGHMHKHCFSLTELVIVITIIGLIAAIAIPRFSDASRGAKLAQLQSNLAVVREAIEYYPLDHGGRGPSIKDNGNNDNNGEHFVERLVGKTDEDGKIDADGPCGPYLNKFPANPFVDDKDDRAEVRIGGDPAGQGNKGWHYDPTTTLFSADDSPEHAAL